MYFIQTLKIVKAHIMNDDPKILDIVGTKVRLSRKKDILEKILKFTSNPTGMCHVVSVNPEILMIARSNAEFKRVVETAQINIADGAGVVLAAQILHGSSVERVPGVDLMLTLLDEAGRGGLRTGLIGGMGTLAEEIANCYQEKYPKASFFGIEGMKDISQPDTEEIGALFSIVAARRPHILFFAFGSPEQELWIEHDREHLAGTVCIGVGGSFDFIGGRVARAPLIIRSLYLEWLYRLIRQPWRARRQLRLIVFVLVLLKQRLLG